MAADHLSYWKPSTVEAVLGDEDPLLTHAASGQYGRVHPGDTVWIITAWSGGQLVLLGRIVVDRVTDQATAARLLGTDDLWTAPYHILAAPGRAEPAREVDLLDIAPALRFESERDRLDVDNGIVDPKQLQTMRRLTPQAAELMRRRWGEDTEYAEALAAVRDEQQTSGAGFGTAISNREVERAAVGYVTSHFEGDGWQVDSVERDRIGFDLLCTRGGDRRHVEVKGTRGAVPTFIITEGERRRMEADPYFWLCVVTDALSATSRLHEFTGLIAAEQYEFVPLAYRAISIN